MPSKQNYNLKYYVSCGEKIGKARGSPTVNSYRAVNLEITFIV